MSRWEAAGVGEELGAAAAVGAVDAVACMLWAEADSHKVPHLSTLKKTHCTPYQSTVWCYTQTGYLTNFSFICFSHGRTQAAKFIWKVKLWHPMQSQYQGWHKSCTAETCL